MALVVTEARSYSAGSRRNTSGEAHQSSCGPASQPVSEITPEMCCGEELRSFRADDGRYISVCMKCGKETTHKGMAHYGGSPWIGVDLDGTLARDAFDAENPERIGEPVEPMVRRVRQWVAEGKTVKVFTARASVPRQVALVKRWLEEHDLPELEVTNAKDFKMVELWDDRAVQVDRNLGQPISHRRRSVNATGPDVAIVARRQSRGSFVSKLRMFFAL